MQYLSVEVHEMTFFAAIRKRAHVIMPPVKIHLSGLLLFNRLDINLFLINSLSLFN